LEQAVSASSTRAPMRAVFRAFAPFDRRAAPKARGDGAPHRPPQARGDRRFLFKSSFMIVESGPLKP
jgi:hypothetical protein